MRKNLSLRFHPSTALLLPLKSAASIVCFYYCRMKRASPARTLYIEHLFPAKSEKVTFVTEHKCGLLLSTSSGILVSCLG